MESDEEELIQNAMQHVTQQYQDQNHRQPSPHSPSPNDAIRSMLRNLAPSSTILQHPGNSPMLMANMTSPPPASRAVLHAQEPEGSAGMDGGTLVVATLHLTPTQVAQLIQFCTLQRLPMPQLSQLPTMGALPSPMVGLGRPPPPLAAKSTFTVSAGEPTTPPHVASRNGPPPTVPSPLHHPSFMGPRSSVVVGGRPAPSIDVGNGIPMHPNAALNGGLLPASVFYNHPPQQGGTTTTAINGLEGISMPQPGDEAFTLPDYFGEFVRISPAGHDPIRNPGKGVPLARMVLLKIPHGWGPPHMMDMLQKLEVKCYFARKHIKMGPRGEVSKGSGKVLIHEREEARLMEMSGSLWCVPEGFYKVRNREAAANYLETNKHRWGKHLPYELLKVEREERELCEKGRVAMNGHTASQQQSNGMMLNGNSCSPMGGYGSQQQGSLLPFRVSSTYLDDMGTLSPSATSSSSNLQRMNRNVSGGGFMQSNSTMSLTSNTSSFECLP